MQGIALSKQSYIVIAVLLLAARLAGANEGTSHGHCPGLDTLTTGDGTVICLQTGQVIGGGGASAAMFFIEENGAPAGPFEISQLRQRIAAGTLTTATLIWTEGMEVWQPAASVDTVAALFSGARAGHAATPPPMNPGVMMPNPSAQATAGVAADPANGPGFLAGIWRNRGQLPVPGYGATDAEVAVTYRDDGGFSIDGRYLIRNPHGGTVPVQVRGAGRWSAASVGSGRLSLSVDGSISLSAPPEYGAPPETQTLMETDHVEILDHNTIRDSDGVVWARANR